MKPVTLFLMRHGAVYNPNHVLYGRLPRFPLSIEGKSYVKEQSLKLKGQGILYIYASPLLRTRQTAVIVSDNLGVKISYSKDLIEVRTLFERMPVDEYKKNYQSIMYEKRFTQKGQESVSEILSRMKHLMDKIVNNNVGKTVLVVSHGDPIVIFKAYLMGKTFDWDFKIRHYLKTGDWFKCLYNGTSGTVL